MTLKHRNNEAQNSKLKAQIKSKIENSKFKIMKKIQFEEIIKSAWQLAIKSRLLWFFGIFTGGGMWVSFQTDNLDFNNLAFQELMQKVFASLKEPLFIGILLFMILLFVVAVLLSFVARAAMLQGIDEKNKSGAIGTFKQLLNFGFSKLIKVILMELIYFVPSIIIMALSALLFFALAASAQKVIILTAILLFFFYFLVISFFRGYSYCFLVYENEGPWTAIRSGWNLLTKNIGEVITAGVLKMALVIAAGIVTIIVLAVATLPLVLVCVLVLIFVGNMGLYITIGIGLVVLLVVFMAIRGFLNTFFYSYTVFVYRRLAGK